VLFLDREVEERLPRASEQQRSVILGFGREASTKIPPV